MKKSDYLVIGGGSGGIASARRAAAYGAQVTLIENAMLGGTCVNVGCVPKKVMWNVSQAGEDVAAFNSVGLRLAGNIDFMSLKSMRDSYIARLNGVYAKNLEKSGIELVRGWAKFVDHKVVKVGDKLYAADHILIATGGAPILPSIPGAEYGDTSDGFFLWDSKPEKVAIVGSGYIAVEIAGLLSGLGCEVTLICRKDGVLRSFDKDIRSMLQEHMTKTNINILEYTEVSCVEKHSGKLKIELSKGSSMIADRLLWAIGRKPRTADLELEKTGIFTRPDGSIESDAWEKTAVAGIYALGDVVKKIDLTPVAIAAGRRLADRVFGGMGDRKLDYENVASVVFSHPPIGSVGLTESQAIEKYSISKVKVYKSRFINMFYALSEDKQFSQMKLVTILPDEKIVGLHVIGRGADEMLQGFAVAVKMGATKKDFDDTVAIHPVAAEEFVTMT